MLPLAHADQATADGAAERSSTQPPGVLPPPVTVPQPPVCSTEPPGPISASTEPIPSCEATRARVGRKLTTKSPVVELVKIVVGGVAGLAIAYCLLLFGFQIDIFERLASSKPAGSREATGRPAVSQTSVATETKSDAGQQAEGRLASPNLAATAEPAVAAATPDAVRDAPNTDLSRATADPSQPAGTSLELAEQGHGDAKLSRPSASGVASDTAEGQASEPVLASAQPADAASEGPAATPTEAAGPSGTPTPVTTVRLAVPAKDEQRQATEQLREIFKRQYADASTPDGQVALAALLRNEASKLGDDPVAKFVMLKEAYDNALGGGDYGLTENVARELCGAYDVDLNNVMVHLLSTAAKSARTNEARQDITVKAVKFIEMLTEIERFDDALALAAAVDSLAGRLRDTELRRLLTSARENARTKKHAWEAVQKASERLQAVPDDPAANLIMGKHLCLVKDDWTHGLPMLAKGGVPELAAAAAMDLAGAIEPAKQVEVGDIWWALAETKQGEERKAMMLRAGFWYRQAESQLPADLARIKITQRLADISKLSGPIDGPLSRPPLALAPFDEKTANQHQAAWAKHLGVPIEMTNSIGMKFLLIPPGEFQMGSSAEEVASLLQEAKQQNSPQYYIDRIPSEAPKHTVRVTKPFYLGACEVTQAEYEGLMGNNPSYFKGKPARPVEQVTWYDAMEFCRKLSELINEKKMRAVYRLPTEAEWEYACRAGTSSRFGIGKNADSLTACGWWKQNSQEQTQPAGRLRPNAWGLQDMHGNVWEWCSDWYDSGYYRVSPMDDPIGPESGMGRADRGGAYDCNLGHCRSTYRSSASPSHRSRILGFRVAMTLAR